MEPGLFVNVHFDTSWKCHTKKEAKMHLLILKPTAIAARPFGFNCHVNIPNQGFKVISKK